MTDGGSGRARKPLWIIETARIDDPQRSMPGFSGGIWLDCDEADSVGIGCGGVVDGESCGFGFAGLVWTAVRSAPAVGVATVESSLDDQVHESSI